MSRHPKSFKIWWRSWYLVKSQFTCSQYIRKRKRVCLLWKIHCNWFPLTHSEEFSNCSYLGSSRNSWHELYAHVSILTKCSWCISSMKNWTVRINIKLSCFDSLCPRNVRDSENVTCRNRALFLNTVWHSVATLKKRVLLLIQCICCNPNSHWFTPEV